MLQQSAATTPFELHELRLVSLVAFHGSFTRAAATAAITQSSLTRLVQGVESRLGFPLFERTTRRVRLTEAGQFLLSQTEGVAQRIEQAVRRTIERFVTGPKEIRIGVSRSVALAHLPGFFFGHQRHSGSIRTQLHHGRSDDLLTQMENDQLDVAVLGEPRRLPASLRVTHRIQDVFVVIASARAAPPPPAKSWTRALRHWFSAQNWLTITRRSNAGSVVGSWLQRCQLEPAHVNEVNNFDLIVMLAALGVGIGLVPRRAIALFPRKKLLQRLPLPDLPQRDLVVVTRHPPLPNHVRDFVENILF